MANPSLSREPSTDEKVVDEHLESSQLGQRVDNTADDEHINLTWRSWLVVFICCFAIMAQVFVVVAAGSVIGFIVRDISNPGLVGWIIQAPLLMQSVLSPVVGRLSDVLDRRYLAALPPLVAFAGAVMSAKAETMTSLIIGGILIGFTLSTIAIVQSIPAEILPLKYRAIANGFAFLGGAVGGLVGGLAHGWRNIYWMQAAFHLITSIGFLLFYFPPPPRHPKMSVKQILWACDPIVLLIVGATLLLLALDWGAGTYEWSDPHVIAPLVVGFAVLIAFGLYEAYGRTDGIVAHVFFERNNNFALSVGAFAIEGWMFYSAVNSVVPQIVLNLGYATDSWTISKRQLLYSVPSLVASIPISLYATKYKDLKTPLIATFSLFFVVSVCYGTITPKENKAQLAYNVLAGIGQSGPLTLLVALVQFTSPHEYLSTATGLAFSARAIGGAFGSAVLDAIINSKLKALPGNIGVAAINAGLPSTSVTALVTALAGGAPAALAAVPGINANIISAAVSASRNSYAKAYQAAFLSILPFIAVAILAIFMVKNVGELMTEHVEATVEKGVTKHVESADA
ncbi:hypothetical protein RQP46_001020 [Phenoliferia psychrophenolica]